jgi:Carboxypeptidase regulatory-like domain
MATTVAGKVTDLTGAGLAGIEVHASNQGQGADGHATTTDDGNYQITNLDAGSYDLHVSSPGVFEPKSYPLHVKQHQNMMGRNFKKIRDQ